MTATGDGPSTAGQRSGWPEQTQPRRRGHDFYPSTDVTAAIPALYATDGIPFSQKLIHLHYFTAGCDWWIAEVDPSTGEGFGYACLGDPEMAEWGYVDLVDLERLSADRGLVIVSRDLDWTPKVAALADLPGAALG